MAKAAPKFSLNPKQSLAQDLLGGPQRHTLLVGGSRSGKTFILVRAIMARALRASGSRHCILRFRYNAVRSSIWLDTLPKVRRLCFPQIAYRDSRQDGYVELPNGAQIWFGGLDDKDRTEKILGQEYATLYFNECSQIPYSSVVIAQTRLAQQVAGIVPRAYYDLNPTGTGHWSHRIFVEHRDPMTGRPMPDPDDYKWMYLNPRDNEANLAKGYIKSLESLPTRARRRFLEGHYTAEVDGALWTQEGIERCRLDGPLPEMRRVVIGVDPSGTAGKDDKRNDSIGIVAVGVDADGTAYLLEDATSSGGPAEWGSAVIKCYLRNKADTIIAEANFGGAMVRHVIQTAADSLGVSRPSVGLVTASRGKAIRAEPVSALYEQGKVRHWCGEDTDEGKFMLLEDQLLNFSTNGWLGEKSPDRADAAIWGITALAVRTSPIGEFCAPILSSRTRDVPGTIDTSDPTRQTPTNPYVRSYLTSRI